MGLILTGIALTSSVYQILTELILLSLFIEIITHRFITRTSHLDLCLMLIGMAFFIFITEKKKHASAFLSIDNISKIQH